MRKSERVQFQAQNSAALALRAKFNHGVALHQQGRLADAERIYGEVLLQQPKHFDALHLLGVIALQTRRTELGAELIRDAIGINAKVAAAHNNLGVALKDLERPADALASYDEAIALNSNYAEAYYNRGIVLKELKQRDAAIASYDKAIALKADYAEAYSNRGIALKELKQLDAAVASYDKAIALKPNYAEAYYNRGVALKELKQLDAAVASYDKAIALKADFAEAYSNRGVALKELMQLDAAIASYDKAIALKADLAEAYSNRGVALKELKQVDAAIASYDKAIALKADFAEAYWNKSLATLLCGDFDRGWELYEFGWGVQNARGNKRDFVQPLWLGKETIGNKTILLHGEQGLGDTIQFCRYVKLVADLGAKVILVVPRPLVSLLANLSGVAQLAEEGSPLPAFDYQCPLMSLPLAFKTTLSNIPANIPYLKSNPEKKRFWKESLGEKDKFRVGLVWSGGFRPNQPELWSVNSRRNIPLAELALLKHPDIEFYSLQKGQPAESELAELVSNNWDGPHIVDFTSQLKDFSDTAALVENLDLVISVDTSTAHLVGALGKPVWILNRFDTCWRWLLDREDSPWYPTARLFRQQRIGSWTGVVDRVKNELWSVIG